MDQVRLNLRVNTKSKVELDDNEEVEPMSPTSEYLMSDVLTLYVLGFLELAIPVHFPSTLAFLKDVFINVHPRFSSIAIENKKGKKMWKRVEVNVEDHIKVPKFSEGLLSTDQSYNEQLEEYVSKIATSKLPQHKPLWELHIINYPCNNAAAIFIFKIHHAIADGTSLMGAVLSCFKRVENPSLPLTFPSGVMAKTADALREKKRNTSTVQTVMNGFRNIPKFISSMFYSLYDFGEGIRLIVSEDSETPIRSGKTDMTLPYSTRVCSLTLSLIDVKRIKTLLGVTVNDIIIGIIFLGTRLYIQETEQGQVMKKNKRRSTASIFVNVRRMKGNVSLENLKKEKAWGNRISNIEVPLPNLEDDDLTNPLKFILKAHKLIKRKRSGTFSLHLMTALLHGIRTFAGLQAAAQSFERRWKNSSFAITNIIGPTEQVSLGNHPVKGFYFVPTGINLSLTVSVLSYMEDLRIGLTVENGFIDHQRLITCVENAFHSIFQAAMATSNAGAHSLM